jgi:hypothetical protein
MSLRSHFLNSASGHQCAGQHFLVSGYATYTAMWMAAPNACLVRSHRTPVLEVIPVCAVSSSHFLISVAIPTLKLA